MVKRILILTLVTVLAFVKFTACRQEEKEEMISWRSGFGRVWFDLPYYYRRCS